MLKEPETTWRQEGKALKGYMFAEVNSRKGWIEAKVPVSYHSSRSKSQGVYLCGETKVEAKAIVRRKQGTSSEKGSSHTDQTRSRRDLLLTRVKPACPLVEARNQ